MTHGELLSDELRRALHGEAWHGPSVKELTEAMHAEEAMQHPIPTAHSIWELTAHMTSWANIALRRINGGQVEPYENEDWPVVTDFSDEHWSSTREALTNGYERLSEVVLGMTDAQLLVCAPKSERTIAGMVSGVAQHAAYHGGQIAMLKKIVTTHHRRTAL
jgi:uncharacterized damage-inducible protein DinB